MDCLDGIGVALNTVEVAVLVAVPEFNGRVSPTFDFCHRVSLWRLDERGFQKTGERKCSSLGSGERAEKLQSIGVGLLLCGAIGQELEGDIRSRGIEVLAGVSGSVVEVVAAYASHTLDHPKFRLPGVVR
ncbi:MAG: NifB/NifX family molybdenum-iron cluster-binding protein [Acidobacteriota bacterium]